MSKTIYSLGERSAVRGVLNGLASFAGPADVRGHDSTGWLAVVPTDTGHLGIRAAKLSVTVSVTLPDSSVCGDPPPPELLLPASAMADAMKVAESLDRPLVLTAEDSTIDLAGVMTIQTYAERPGPSVAIEGLDPIVTMPTDALKEALRRAVVAVAPKSGDDARQFAPFVGLSFADEHLAVVATDGYTVFAQRFNGLGGIPAGLPAFVVESRVTASAIANLAAWIGPTTVISTVGGSDARGLVFSGGGAQVVVPLSTVGLPVTVALEAMFGDIDFESAPTVFISQDQMRSWMKPFAKAGTLLRVTASPEGGSLASAGDNPKGQVPHQLSLPAGTLTSSGIGIAGGSTEHVARALGASLGKPVELSGATEEDGEENGEESEGSAGMLAVSLVAFPGSSDEGTRGFYLRNTSIPDMAIFVAGHVMEQSLHGEAPDADIDAAA